VGIAPSSAPRAPQSPAGFHALRNVALGPHRLLEVFPDLDRLPGFARLPATGARRARLVRQTVVQVVPGPVWMYVAPHEIPALLKRVGFFPFTSPKDCIAIGRGHLYRSARFILYLDILHELVHVLQRAEGHDLWVEGYRYADRPTEIEAYRFTVDLARAHGASDAFLREYLRVNWITPQEHALLLRNVGVSRAGGPPVGAR
jgi:hypothetical protein